MKNIEYKTEWERARLIAFYAVSPYAKRGSLHSMQDLFQFEWEKDDLPELTEDQMNYCLRKLGKYVDEKGEGYNA